MGSKSVIIVGHSLGGACAVSLMALGLLPYEYAGKYEVATFGAPPVFHGKHPSQSDLLHAKIQQWIMEEDPVPRSLGSDLSSDYAKVLEFGKSLLDDRDVNNMNTAEDNIAGGDNGSSESHGVVISALQNEGKRVIAYTKAYVHLHFAQILWLRKGQVFGLVPPSSALRVRTFSVPSPSDHKTDAYERGLQSLQQTQPRRYDEQCDYR